MTESNIRRLIQNQKSEHSPHAFAGRRGGMEDFNSLIPVLTKLPVAKLQKWMRLIDAMRETHEGCAPCYAKILAYSILFTEARDPGLCERYRRHYQLIVSRYFSGRNPRDIMAEVIASRDGISPEAELDTAESRAAIAEFMALVRNQEEEDLGIRKRR